ncbi:MAG: winged helix-turn-helix domain-containing protein [Elusimicrobia bacterium]|nr:winged helix-turn-helix domain-containing protein [Elusimicrobiota bacterium]
MPITQPDDILTTAEVCRLLKITRPTLYHWIEEGRLTPWKKLGDGSTFLFLRNFLARKHLKKYSRPGASALSGQAVNPVRDNGRFADKDGGIIPPSARNNLHRRQEPAAFSNGVNRPRPPERVVGGPASQTPLKIRTPARILLVSRDTAVAQQSCSDLQSQGYYVSVAGDFSRIEAVFKSGEPPNIVVLDLEFPCGWRLFEEIKRLVKESNQPSPGYLLLSGSHGAPQDAARAFKKGAWDFLKRPLASSVFMARVRLALRRRFWSELDASPRGRVLTSRDELIALDPNSRILEIRDPFKQPVSMPLTRKEAELLRLFLKRPGMVFSKTTLLEVVWGYVVNIKTRTVDCHIKNLRQKLNPHGSRIETRYSSGYCFIDTPPAKP